MSIGDNIKILRKKQHLTQKELAKKCDLAEITIRQYESNKREPKSEIVAQIAMALDVSPYVLYGLDSLSQEETHELLNDSMKTIAKLWSSNMNAIKFLDDSRIGKIIRPFTNLNTIGQDKAIEQVELLTKIPEYQKKDE